MSDKDKPVDKIVEGNILIAEFMGGLVPFASRNMYGEETGTRVIEVSKIKSGFQDLRVAYHTSWDWLMPVVEMCKEKSLKLTGYGFRSHDIPDAIIAIDIRAVWLAVVEFIKFWNQTKNK